LTDNYRQTHPWERDALLHLRRGDLLPALRAYARHDRLHHHPDTTTLRDTIAERYVAALDDSAPLQVVALAGSRTGAAALNTAIRERLQADGRLGDDQPVGEHALAVGEVVLITRNDHPRGLLNGTRGIVTAISRRGVRLHLDDQRDVTVPTGWAADRLRAAYAMTVHKAQGLTVDIALVDTTGLGDRNSAYVAASRARHRTELHHTDTDQLIDTLTDDPFTPRPLGPAEAHAQVVSRLGRHREQRLATDQTPQWSPARTRRRPYDPYEHDRHHHGPDRSYGISR
jgi:ATP-dependent exoDNAse (exonuclease V) alpha subunit